MATLSFGAMCRYSGVSRLKWSNNRFEYDSSTLKIEFEIRKNAQFHQGNKVIVVSTKEEVRSLKLLRSLQSLSVVDYVFFPMVSMAILWLKTRIKLLLC